MEKAHLAARPIQLIARQRRKGMSIVRQWRQRQRKRFADDDDSFPPRRSAIVVLSVSRGESGTVLQIFYCMQGPGETGETGPIQHGTCASLYSNAHGMVAARRTKVSSSNLPLPLSTTRL